MISPTLSDEESSPDLKNQVIQKSLQLAAEAKQRKREMEFRKAHPFTFDMFEESDNSATPSSFNTQDSSSTITSPSTSTPRQFSSTASDLLKQIESTADLPEDIKSENISEDEKQARSLANAIADASERSLTDEET